ncbi:MAG: 30S ribosomal protein S6 [Oscillatoria sp. PMC 1068.18]|nr:30S ribosomal protein S6 [Oscillatoria sp. PMC 1076.18]MEC4989297.1 30S ribosomal protein S6 [Oscillatoria sp. PMC 1068.18]
MNSYETMYIVRPNLSEDQQQQIVGKYRDFITERGARQIEIKVLGKRRLAYEIGKHQDGTYVQMNYLAEGATIAPLERDMRLSDDVIRYLTLKLREGKPGDIIPEPEPQAQAAPEPAPEPAPAPAPAPESEPEATPTEAESESEPETTTTETETTETQAETASEPEATATQEEE